MILLLLTILGLAIGAIRTHIKAIEKRIEKLNEDIDKLIKKAKEK